MAATLSGATPALRWARRMLLCRLRRQLIECNGNVLRATQRIGMTRAMAYRLLSEDERRWAREISQANPPP